MKFINEDTAVIYYVELKADGEGKILIEAENYNIGYNLISEGLYKFYSNSLNALKTFIAYGYYPNRSDNAKLQELFSTIESKAHEDVVVESREAFENKRLSNISLKEIGEVNKELAKELDDAIQLFDIYNPCFRYKYYYVVSNGESVYIEYWTQEDEYNEGRRLLAKHLLSYLKKYIKNDGITIYLYYDIRDRMRRITYLDEYVDIKKIVLAENTNLRGSFKGHIEDEIESWGVLITLDGKFFDMIASFDSEDDAYEYIKNREEQDHAEEMYGLEYEVVSLNDYSDFEINEDDLFEIEEIDNE